MPGYPAAARTSALQDPAPETDGALLLRTEEAAHLLGISRTAVYGLLRTGELQGVKISRRRRIPRAAVEAYVARLTEQAGSRPRAM